MRRTALAIAAHPDDIEFVMSGTLLQLRSAGWEVHYFNVGNGCYGSATMDANETKRVRLAEAQAAAELLGATFHPPLCDDLHIFYAAELMAQVAAIVRQVQPSIVLTHALSDYMEDHQNTARLAVFGAFSRGMPSYKTTPKVNPFSDDIAVYHAQPHGNRTPLGEIVVPSIAVDVGPQLDTKRELLAQHASQASWLGESQAMAYLRTMEQLGREVGKLAGEKFEIAEGWRKHIHLGLSHANFCPLTDALSNCSTKRDSSNWN